MLKNIFTNSFGILISRVLGFLRDLLMASILGINVFSDIFFLAFKLPNLFRRVFAEGAFTQVFIPSYAKSKHKLQFSSVLFLQFTAFIILLSLLVSIFSTIVTKTIGFGFDDTTIALASPLLAICFYYLPLIFVVTFLASLLQYKHHFATSAFSTALLNLSIIGALLIAINEDKHTLTYYLSYSVVIGGILQVLIHLLVIKKLKIKFFTFDYKKSKKEFEKSKFYKKFYPAVFGSSSAHISSFLDTWLASFLVLGTISTLYYANRVFQLPLALFAIATSIAIFPTIAKAIKNKNELLALKYMQKSFYVVFILLFIASFIGMFFNDFIISLLFQRGEFTLQDTKNVANILYIYLIGLLPLGIAKIFSLWLYSHERQLKAAKITMIAFVWNIVLSLILIKPYGALGLALASSLSGYVLLHLTLKEFGYNKFLKIIKMQY